MRHSSEKHNVARLRVLLGEKQEAFARLIGCSVHTLQSVETRRLKLSEELARRIAAATDIDLNWLQQDNLTTEPCVANSTFRYTRSAFDNAQAHRRLGTPDSIANIAPDYMLASYGQLRAIISDAAKRGEGGVVIWKLARFIDELRQDYGHDKQLAPVWEFRLRPDSSRVLTFRVRDAGMALARRDIAEHDRIIAKFERAVQANKSGRSTPRFSKVKRHKPKKRQQSGNRGDHT